MAKKKEAKQTEKLVFSKTGCGSDEPPTTYEIYKGEYRGFSFRLTMRMFGKERWSACLRTSPPPGIRDELMLYNTPDGQLIFLPGFDRCDWEETESLDAIGWCKRRPPTTGKIAEQLMEITDNYIDYLHKTRLPKLRKQLKEMEQYLEEQG